MTDRSGNTAIGRACRAARNPVRADRGARFVQITVGGWDNHSGIYTGAVNPSHPNSLACTFDLALGAMISDLRSSGHLDRTLIVCIAEFGRTIGPLNSQNGRDHFPQQAVLLAGGGLRGGTVIGRTTDTGSLTLDPGWSRQRDVRPEDIGKTQMSPPGTGGSNRPAPSPSRYRPFADRRWSHGALQGSEVCVRDDDLPKDTGLIWY